MQGSDVLLLEQLANERRQVHPVPGNCLLLIRLRPQMRMATAFFVQRDFNLQFPPLGGTSTRCVRLPLHCPPTQEDAQDFRKTAALASPKATCKDADDKGGRR